MTTRVEARNSGTPVTIQAPTKESYSSLLLSLINNPTVRQERGVIPLLQERYAALSQTTQLTPEQTRAALWAEKLLFDGRVSNYVVEQLLKLSPAPPVAALPAIAFGKAEWAKYFGDVGAEPPLPANIRQILEAPCPIWRDGRKVQETHLLVLVPRRVNNQPLNMKMLGELVKKPLQGNATQYHYFDLGKYKDPDAPASHWALISRDVIPGSQNKKYSDQQKLVQGLPGYEVPKLLDATVAILMEHVKSGTRLYNDSPLTYTRCQEKWNKDWQLIVGGFSAAGPDVHYHTSYLVNGVGAQRKF